MSAEYFVDIESLQMVLDNVPETEEELYALATKRIARAIAEEDIVVYNVEREQEKELNYLQEV